MNSPSNKPADSWSHLLHLLPILVALILGILVGVFYGEAMWKASGGPTKQQATLEKAVAASTAQGLKLDGDPKAAWEVSHASLVNKLQKTNDIVQLVQKEPPSSIAGASFRLIKFLGDLFLQMLKLLVLPLVVTSMIAGIGGLGDIRGIGRLGRTTMAYFLVTTIIAVVIGTVLVVTISPGSRVHGIIEMPDERVERRSTTDPIDTILELVVGSSKDPGSGMIPSNLFQAANATNVLGLIVFSLVLGGALTTLGERGRQVIEFFATLTDAILQIVRLVMIVAPVGIFAIVAYNIAVRGGGEAFWTQAQQLGWYVATISIGLISQFLILLLILRGVGRSPMEFVLGAGRPLLTAFSTASSSATLPLSIQSMEDENGISKQSANFVLPLGATVNMNGTALYEAVAAVFIAQLHGISLDPGQLIVVVITATLAAVGAAGIPEAGLVTLVMVVTAVGLPASGIGAILAVDWFLDRLRTTINVFGDMVGCAVTDRLVPPEHRGGKNHG
ncbi:dicarboxylate/amino acid:cation symporter [bacterium]|nr:dicarboxylate/amino acid:cation symporter [bacterium]